MSTTNTEQVVTSAPKLKEPKQERSNLGHLLARSVSSGLVAALVVAIGLLWSVPTFGLFVSSFRPPSLINTTGWWTGLVPPWQFTIQNYMDVIQAQGFGRAFLNSIIIAVPGTIFPLLVGAITAYAFAWMKFPLRNWIFLGIVALQIIPLQIALVPVLGLYTMLGLNGQYAAVWLAHTAFGLPFSIYLLRNFFAALPSDLMESAHIDGASHVRIFWNIILPLSVPALASLAIFQFMWVWNDLLISLIFLGGNPQNAPMTLIIANLVNTYGNNYQVLTAAAFISMALPLVVFFSMQRYFVRGILAGSVKG
ncbi:carbohydrate ABC transporter permease [Ktedonobacter racemifer]|uniref:Binding-protein-dependent transport systems inner membrane component n=1 Tax=Ktedonobacter racemifer DSM 44963 TaxID=485913 RepID=D6U0W4_KTERA|nr:carbohydrate ABC transporter permease [Ktedonobacter racemifer]EFH82454.1 binding-protein-dependent transport systems inner membrane component [Ktedonobacter racemifer DSM 44963]